MAVLGKDGGTFQEATVVAHDGTGYKDGVLWAKVGGNWEQIYPPPAGSAALKPIWTAGNTASHSRSDTSSAYAGAEILADGSVNLFQVGTDGNWLPEGGTASDYRAKWVRVSGDATYTNGVSWNENTWATLNATRKVQTQGPPNAGTKTATVDITIEHTPSGETNTFRLDFSAYSQGF